MNNNPLVQEEHFQISKGKLILGAVLVILLPYLCLLPYLKYFGYDLKVPEVILANFWITRILLWLLLGGLFLYAYKAERAKFFLWPEKKYSFGIYIAFFATTFMIVLVSVSIVSLVLRLLHLLSESQTWERMGKLFEGHPLLVVFTCITAGITEELMFRGFLQPRLELLFKNRWIAITGSAFFFALIHIGFGTVQNIAGPFVIGMVFAIHYSYFRNIRFLIVFHIVWDLLAIFLVMYVKAKTAG